ncbi:MAG: substrate-binding domain-containing protein, partial [Chloroflexota bacterium]
LQAVLDRGLRVPEDVAIVGFDNWSLSLTTKPPLTTMATPLIEIGQQAMAALLAQIKDEISEPIRQFMPVELLVRQSTVADGVALEI